MKAKSMWESSTVWLNLVGIGAILLELATQSLPLDAEWMALLLAVLNLLNRFRTKQPIKV